MGINFKDLAKPCKIGVEELAGRTLVMDADNHLYQFLTAIRTPQGDPITDSNGRPVSHLLGLFSRTVNLMKNGLLIVYVFDGKPPELKGETLGRRREVRRRAEESYAAARERGDKEAMKREAVRASKLQPEMIEDARQLISALGLPWPSRRLQKRMPKPRLWYVRRIALPFPPRTTIRCCMAHPVWFSGPAVIRRAKKPNDSPNVKTRIENAIPLPRPPPAPARPHSEVLRYPRH